MHPIVEVLKEKVHMRQDKLFEDLAKCNYKTPSESSGSNSRMMGNGLIGLDRTTAIKAKLDAVMNKLSSDEKMMHNAHEVRAVRE